MHPWTPPTPGEYQPDREWWTSEHAILTLSLGLEDPKPRLAPPDDGGVLIVTLIFATLATVAMVLLVLLAVEEIAPAPVPSPLPCSPRSDETCLIPPVNLERPAAWRS